MTKFPHDPILIVDDEQELLQGYKLALLNYGINNVVLCSNSTKVPALLEEHRFVLVLLDLFMPHKNGKELLIEIKETHPSTPVIVITGSDSLDLAIECERIGFFDYMTKPVEITRLVSNIKRATELLELRKELDSFKSRVFSSKLNNPEAFEGILTRDSAMFSVFRYLEAVAASPQPLLITGESGAGKELIARAAHKLYNKESPFIPVNSAGLDDALFSDTLFGHKRGAFTGADKDREGLITRAEGGILFLDEIGDLEIKSQIKLLRLLQQREYYPLGADKPSFCNIRIIAATNADLVNRIKDGSFRQDLYYRLKTHYVHLPPLRDRTEDLPLLTELFVEKGCAFLKKEQVRISGDVYELLEDYPFPGNIRELESMVYNALSVSNQGILSLEAIKTYIKQQIPSTTGRPLAKKKKDKRKILGITTTTGDLPTLKEMEQYLVQQAMEIANHNQSMAAPMLGISQPALSKRLKRIKTS